MSRMRTSRPNSLNFLSKPCGKKDTSTTKFPIFAFPDNMPNTTPITGRTGNTSELVRQRTVMTEKTGSGTQQIIRVIYNLYNQGNIHRKKNSCLPKTVVTKYCAPGCEQSGE